MRVWEDMPEGRHYSRIGSASVRGIGGEISWHVCNFLPFVMTRLVHVEIRNFKILQKSQK